MCISSRNQIENSEEYLSKLLSLNSDDYSKLRNEVFPNSNLKNNSEELSSDNYLK
ncbi:MAG: hypothetical protein RSC24_13025 [Clostridium sp.]